MQLATYTTYGRSAGSARVRVFDWLEHLQIHATSSVYTDQSSNSVGRLMSRPSAVVKAEIQLRLDARRPSHSTALVSRQASPFSNGSIEAKLLGGANHGVYDFDDALMHGTRSRFAKLWSKQRVWRSAVESADVVIAGNPYLASYAEKHNRNVVVIPSCIQPDQYVPKVDFDLRETPRAVWLGSPSTEGYLQSVSGALLDLHESRGLRLSIISSGASPLGPLERMVDRREWSAGSFANDLADADFGIMPTDDTEWSRGKCAYKLLQYGAAGLPMVGSPYGANAEVLRMCEGVPARTSVDWRDAMHGLVDESPGQRARRATQGLNAVREHFSFPAWAPTWRKAVGVETE